MKDAIPITPDGLAKLRKELSHLKAVEKPKNIKDIEIARAHGDLSENAEYSAAKDRQGHLAGRIAELEHVTSRAQVINPSELKHKKVYFGATVTLMEVNTESEQTYQIVGIHESDVKAGKISVASPLAKILIGKEEGDNIVLAKTTGNSEFEILSVEYS